MRNRRLTSDGLVKPHNRFPFSCNRFFTISQYLTGAKNVGNGGYDSLLSLLFYSVFDSNMYTIVTSRMKGGKVFLWNGEFKEK